MDDKNETCFILKAMVDKKNKKVIFVESNSDFVDVLLSFLTIPLGTIVSLSRKQSVPIGMNPLNNLYNSVEAMDVNYFNFPDEARKRLLSSPQNGVYFYCQNLKIQLDNAEPTEFFCCASTDCTIKTYKLLSTYRDVPCRCGRSMNREIELTDKEHKGVFVRGMTTFLVTDDLQVVPMSTSATFAIFAEHGITDESTIEEICLNVGSDEVLKLLFASLVSRTVLTDILLKQKLLSPVNRSDLFARGCIRSRKEEKPINQDGTISVKLVFSRSKKMVCYAEASEELVNLLTSFLSVPLGYTARKISDVTFEGSIVNLHKSVQDLGEKFFNSSHHKEILVNPRLAFGLSYRNDLLGILKATHPQYHYAVPVFTVHGFREEAILTTDRSLIPSHYVNRASLTVIDPKFHNNTSEEIGLGLVSQSTSFLVTDSLDTTPISSSTCLSILKEMKVPFSDVEEKIVHIGREEAVLLFLSSFASENSLTSAFIRDLN